MLLTNDTDKQQWDAFVMASDRSTCYHQSGWKGVIENSFGHQTFYLMSKNELGMTEGILPLVQLKSRLFGNFLVSLPYFNYGGVCTTSQESLRRLLDEAKLLAIETNAEFIELRHVDHLYQELPVKTAKVTMRLVLPDNSDMLMKSFPSKLRSQIRRPEKEGMVAKIGREDELDNFYAVFSRNMRDLGTPVYAKFFFRNILETFSETTWICTVFAKKNVPVASGFLIRFKENIEIPWASSLRRYNPLSPNMLLYWSVLKFACQQGCRFFDFGRSTPGEGTYRFKKQWGAQPVQLYWHYWLRNGATLPELNTKNPKYNFAIQAWKRLPVSVTRVLGPAIVKNIP